MFLSIGGTRSSVSNTVVYNKSERSIPTLSWSRGTLAVNDGYERAERFHLNACADYVSRSHFPSLSPSLSLFFASKLASRIRKRTITSDESLVFVDLLLFFNQMARNRSRVGDSFERVSPEFIGI